MRADAPHPEALIAVDGGGTGCRLVLWRKGIPATAESGPANLSSDFEGALRSIRAGLSTLSAHTGCNLGEVPAYLALAGAITPDLCRRAEAALPLNRVRVEEDRRAAVRGALGTEAGGVLHAGTGSFVAVQDPRGNFRTAGGHGHVLGDDASAYSIARAALSASLEAADGTGPATDLTETLLFRFDGAAGVIAFATEAGPDEIARLASAVTDAIDDPVARRIITDGAAYFARILPALGWTDDLPLCLTGGVGPAFSTVLPHPLRTALRPALGTPLDGALALAADFARELPA
ncbi:BadF/BadG/BcrA/BcrD ATPase family protein [Silicimonas algicola]|nr:BadF/BadG/BcrA/BcrD ATPase family protein [Silicimonas algicola]